MKHFENLNDNEIKILCFYAYRGGLVLESDHTKLANTVNICKTDIQKIITILYGNNYLNKVFFNYSYSFCISPSFYLPVLEFLFFNHKDYIKIFDSINLQSSNRLDEFRDFRNFLFKNFENDFIKNVPTFDNMEIAFINVATNPTYYCVIRNLPEKLFKNVYIKGLNDYINDDSLDINYAYWENLKNNTKISQETRQELEEAYSLYSYYSTGKIYTNPDKPFSYYGYALKAVILTNKGDYNNAVTYFDNALKIKNKISEVKNVFINTITNYFYIMALTHVGTKESMKKLDLFTRRVVFMNHPAQLFNLVIAIYFISHEIKHLFEIMYMEKSSSTQLIYQYFQYLLIKYLKLENNSNNKLKELKPDFLLLQHELSEYIDLSVEDKEKLKSLYGDKPALTSIETKQKWEFLLEDIIKTELADLQNNIPKQAQRVIYYYDKYHTTLKPILQTKLKSGHWSIGREIMSHKIIELQKLDLPESDRKIIDYLVNNYYFDINNILPLFVGTELLHYRTPQNILKPVNISEEKPNLVIKKNNDNITITANFTADEIRRLYPKDFIIVQYINNTNIKLIKFSEKEKDIFSKLLGINILPLKAEPLLKQFVGTLGGKIEIFSDITPESSALEKRDSDKHLCLRLSPSGEMFNLDIRVKPNPEGSTYCQPGIGSLYVITESNDVKYQVFRDFENEKNLKREILEFIDTLGCENGNNKLNYILSIENTLKLLEWTRNHDDGFYIEWPEGVKIKLKKPIETPKIHISFCSKQNWFEIEGEIQIDEHTIIKLETFLALLRDSQDRFIRLNDNEYTILSVELKKQLSRLESLLSLDNRKLKIPQIAVNLIGDILDSDMDIKHDQTIDEIRSRIAESEKITISEPVNLNGELRYYQLIGYQWITRMNNWGAGVCLADDMGLGKTIQTISCLLNKAKEGPSLVVTPASVVLNWRNELMKFAPTLQVSVLNQTTDRHIIINNADKFDIILCSYGILTTEIDQLKEKEWAMVCLDEAHIIKNRDTKMSAAAMQLNANNRLILTGTPIQNNLGELWNLFQFINPGLLGSYEHFRQKYIIPIEMNEDFERRNQLKRLIRPFILRRTKAEVVEELPEKIEIIIPVEQSSQELHIYEGLRRKAELLLQESDKVDIRTLAMITKLRQAACSVSLVEKKWDGDESKTDLFLELIDDLCSNNHRILVFSQFTSFFNIIRKRLDDQKIKYLYLDGSTTIQKRENLVADFQSGQSQIFLISLKAGGLGLNLTNADYVIHLDPWWNPAVEQQATDRAHRIGQKNKVTVYHLITQHTIEEKILRLHKIKRDMTDSLLEGSNISHKMTAQDLLELINNKGCD